MSMGLELQPPSDVSIEASLLGALFVEPTAIDEVADLLSGSDFYDDLYGQVYDTFVLLAETGEHTELKIVLSRLKKYGITSDGMDSARIAKIVGEAASASSIRWYAHEIIKYANHRRMIQLVYSATNRLHKPGAEVPKICGWLSGSIESIESRESVDVKSIYESAAESIKSIESNLGVERTFGCSTSIGGLDLVMGGLCRAELTILCARPSVGKTALAMQMCNTAAYEGRKVLFVSLEMRRTELANRVLCAIAAVDGRKIRSGELTDDELSRLKDASEILKGRPLSLYAPYKASIRNIRAAAKLESIRGPVDLLCVDYLSLIVPKDARRNKNEQVGQISSDLKCLAKELDIPVLALCQLNRTADGEVPKLSHLRDSGEIEQDADIVVSIHHEEIPTIGGGKKKMAILSVLKNRHGPMGTIRCNWSPSATSFEEAHEELPME